MRILVTGADGFVGRHLCRYLRARGDTVVEARGPKARPEGGAALALDVTRPESVREVIDQSRPEGLIHLAGVSSVAKSHQDPSGTFAVNALGVVYLLSTLKERSPETRVVVVGSGEVYGALPAGTCAREDAPARPLSPYAASKAAAEVAALQFARGYRLRVVCARPFNHLGPGQEPTFVVPSFAEQLQRIRLSRQEPVLRVGDLSPVRDFSHVEDVCAAYRLLLERGEAGEAYNISSGQGRTIRSLLDEMLELSGVQARIEVDPARLRPAEIPSLVGDPARMRALGWEPKRSISEALGSVLDERAAALAATSG